MKTLVSVRLHSRCILQQQQIFIKYPVTGCWKPSLSLFTAAGRHHKEACSTETQTSGAFEETFRGEQGVGAGTIRHELPLCKKQGLDRKI